MSNVNLDRITHTFPFRMNSTSISAGLSENWNYYISGNTLRYHFSEIRLKWDESNPNIINKSAPYHQQQLSINDKGVQVNERSLQSHKVWLFEKKVNDEKRGQLTTNAHQKEIVHKTMCGEKMVCHICEEDEVYPSLSFYLYRYMCIYITMW